MITTSQIIYLDTTSGENLYNQLNQMFRFNQLENKTIYLTQQDEKILQDYMMTKFEVPILLNYWFACMIKIDHRPDLGLRSFVG